MEKQLFGGDFWKERRPRIGTVNVRLEISSEFTKDEIRKVTSTHI